MTVGERMRKIRIEKNMTQKQVGERCGMADSAIRRYESGRGNPTFDTLERIAAALEVPVTALMGYVLRGKTADGKDSYGPPDDVIDFDEPLKTHWSAVPHIKDDDPELRVQINADLSKLNETGQQKAAERVRELTEIPRYQRHQDPPNGE